MSQLDLLIQPHIHDAILLSEAIGLLHDYRKCSDEQLMVQAANPQGSALPRSELSNRFGALTGINIQLLPIQPTARTVTDLLNDNTWTTDILGQYLSRCHNTSHFDKQDPASGKQNYPGIQISSPFGFERDVPAGLTNKLWALPWSLLTAYFHVGRQNLLRDVRSLFTQVGADTRRPTNEVDLWSWGQLVGALYKTALAGVVISGGTPPAARDLRWRLLSVRVDGLGYLLNVVRLPDLLSRQQLLQDGLDRVCCLLEETYPLASEVYRDENGSLYVIADLPDPFGLTNSQGATLRQLLFQEFAKATLKQDPTLQMGGEIVPVLEQETQSWWGQDPDHNNPGHNDRNELPAINVMLSSDVRSQTDIAAIEASWNQHVDVICTVCGLRPQGPGKKAIERNVCDICEQRRLDRSQAWAIEQSRETIWIDEVADVNGRLALIVGQFDLAAWLDGSLVESMFVIAPNEGNTTSKTPSFSRIQRIWQTTRQFWQDVQTDIGTRLSDDRRRLLLYLDKEPDLGPFHVYELDLGAVTLSVVWCPSQPDGSGGYLISADNLNAVARRLGAEQAIYEHAASAAIWQEDYLRQQFIQHSHPVILRNPDAPPGERNRNLLVGHRLIKTGHQDAGYSTGIPILVEPRTFMALVPADQSLNILERIKLTYERQMGKVRDRLPMHLSAVYFPRRTPLRTVLDAGQAMWQRKAPTPQWEVQCIHDGVLPPDRSMLADGTKQFQKTISITLEHSGHTINWYVPAMMGDGVTQDNWYPYVFFRQDQHGNTQPAGRQRAFNINGRWFVHAGDLQLGDQILFSPSTFDFEFLDTTARRFDLFYDAVGRRDSRRTRPFHLEDLDRMEALWGYLKRLKPTQRYQIVSTIEATRETWYGADRHGKSHNDVVFQQFVADTLADAEWPSGQLWSSISLEWRNNLVQAGTSGELTDLAELHMEILKER
jgi:hypothetical protein